LGTSVADENPTEREKFEKGVYEQYVEICQKKKEIEGHRSSQQKTKRMGTRGKAGQKSEEKKFCRSKDPENFMRDRKRGTRNLEGSVKEWGAVRKHGRKGARKTSTTQARELKNHGPKNFLMFDEREKGKR